MNRERLLNVARALRESPKPEKFNMDKIAHPCGTPGCALGHYAARPDLQRDFALVTQPYMYGSCVLGPRGNVSYCDEDVANHFDIDGEELEQLFGPPDVEDDEEGNEVVVEGTGGCGGAQTAIDAAEYIERWVAEREGTR